MNDKPRSPDTTADAVMTLRRYLAGSMHDQIEYPVGEGDQANRHSYPLAPAGPRVASMSAQSGALGTRAFPGIRASAGHEQADHPAAMATEGLEQLEHTFV